MAVDTIHSHNDQGNSELDDDDVREKIKTAFCKVYASALVQFWAPASHGDKKILSTSNQPFAVDDENLDSDSVLSLENYRLSCLNNQYPIIHDHDLMTGGPATAFLNHFPLVVKPTPTVDDNKGLTCLLVPVLYHPTSQSKSKNSSSNSNSNSSSCVGVVECCCLNPSLLYVILINLNTQLRKVGLCTFDLQETQPYKTVRRGFHRAKAEIEDGLQMACVLHGLTLGQAWMAYESGNQKLAVKFTGYSDADSDEFSVLLDYYSACDMFPLKIGEGLVGNTLQTYDPLLCDNMDDLTDKDKGWLFSLAGEKCNCSCLAISLRNYTTGGDVDYALEFLWPKTRRNCFFLFESLFLTLKKYLPGFVLACGAQLGEALPLVHVGQNSTTRISTILQGNKSSVIVKDRPCMEGILSCEPKCMKYQSALPPEDEDKNQKSVCFSTSKRRKLSNESYQEEDSSKSESEASSDGEGEDDDDDDDDYVVVIATEYREKTRFFHLRKSCRKFAYLKKKISDAFNLVSESCFKLDFHVDGMCVLLDDDTDLENCIYFYRSIKAPYIPVHVTPTTTTTPTT